jgi:Cu(I)/Ag(I) efflux system membrane fusion protein
MLSTVSRYTTILSLSLITLFAQNNLKIKQDSLVQTVKVKKEHTYVTQKYYGHVKEAESRVIDVSPRYDGYVEKLYVDELYTKVKTGDPLVKVYSHKVWNLKDKFVESFRYRQKEVIFEARERLELIAITKSELEKISKTKKFDSYTTIFAPTDGYIFDKSINQGSAFKDRQTIFKIANLDLVWIEVNIPQEHIPSLDHVESFDIRLKSLSKQFHTKHFKLYPKFSNEKATATVRLMVQNKDHKLFPGMYAMVTSRQKAKAYLTLPKTAVIHKNGHYYSFIKTEFKGEYEPIKIEIKPLNNDTYIITKGLSADEEVVNNALFMMDSDAQINALY